jgi:hypothetical protein
MAEPLSSLIRPVTGPRLSAFERLAPPPPENVVAAELAARTAPGDVVIDIHGRGGWIARNAIDSLRRVYACESMPLTRTVAEIILRPPDLRHLDAALAALAVHPRGDVGLRDALNEPFASRCPTCGRRVVVDEFIWEGDAVAPSRKVFRCSFCRDQSRGQEQRNVAVDADDVKRAQAMEPRPRAWAILRGRFPLIDDDHELPDELLGLYTPRTLLALEGIISRLESDLRAAPIDAALRLGLVHALLPLSRLNSYPGRVAALRIRNGHVQQPGDRQWRERNPWLAFEEGCRQVRTFIQRIEATTGSFHPRPGEDIGALIDGTANVVLRTGSAAQRGNAPQLAVRAAPIPAAHDGRSRVRLVLTQPPIRWSVENLSFAYLATALALGPEQAASLPLEGVFGPPPRNDRGREATALRRSLIAVRPVLAADANVVIILDRGGAAGLVAGVLGGVGAGFRLASALLAESGNQLGGVLEFNLGQPTDTADDHPELAGLPRATSTQPFALADVERAVSQVAEAVLRARGEPAGAERLLGEVLIGLDRLGHLRRLVGTRTFAETEAAVEADVLATEHPAGATEHPPDAAGQPAAGDPPAEKQPPAQPPGIEEPPPWALGSGSATDHVRLFMEIVMGELRRPDHPRLVEIEAGRWWLRDARPADARPPLSDRLEWAVYGLLSTSPGFDEDSFFERVARMFRGYDTPDEEMVRAILTSYRDPSASGVALAPADELSARHAEHGQLVGMLVDYGHRLGLRCWVSPHEQRRAYRGATVGDLLSDEERRTYLPLVAAGEPQTLESMDCIWYLRGKATFIFEVEWTAMLSEPLLHRGPRVPADESIFRFLVLPAERTELVRLKLDRSALLRSAIDEFNWHILKADHVRQLHAADAPSLDLLGPLLGLDPEVERGAEQMALFGS